MEGSKRNLLTSVVASRAVIVEPATTNINLGVVCPMANERDTAERFVREVLAACEPFAFKSIMFFVVFDRVTKTYDNGSKVVPAYLLKPVSVDKTNYKQVLVDGGYYTEADLK